MRDVWRPGFPDRLGEFLGNAPVFIDALTPSYFNVIFWYKWAW